MAPETAVSDHRFLRCPDAVFNHCVRSPAGRDRIRLHSSNVSPLAPRHPVTPFHRDRKTKLAAFLYGRCQRLISHLRHRPHRESARGGLAAAALSPRYDHRAHGSAVRQLCDRQYRGAPRRQNPRPSRRDSGREPLRLGGRAMSNPHRVDLPSCFRVMSTSTRPALGGHGRGSGGSVAGTPKARAGDHPAPAHPAATVALHQTRSATYVSGHHLFYPPKRQRLAGNEYPARHHVEPPQYPRQSRKLGSGLPPIAPGLPAWHVATASCLWLDFDPVVPGHCRLRCGVRCRSDGS